MQNKLISSICSMLSFCIALSLMIIMTSISCEIHTPSERQRRGLEAMRRMGIAADSISASFPNKSYPVNYKDYDSVFHNWEDWLTGAIRYSVEPTQVFLDPFATDGSPSENNWVPFHYYSDGSSFIILSVGPDAILDLRNADTVNRVLLNDVDGSKDILLEFSYDPTNGENSRGDIILFRGQKSVLFGNPWKSE